MAGPGVVLQWCVGVGVVCRTLFFVFGGSFSYHQGTWLAGLLPGRCLRALGVLSFART